MFFAKPQRREHRDNEIIHVILYSGSRINRFRRFSREEDAQAVCVYMYNVWCNQSRTLFKDRAQFPKDGNIDWNVVPEQPLNSPEQLTGKAIAPACSGRPLSWTWAYRPGAPRAAQSSVERYPRIHDVNCFFVNRWIEKLQIR